MTSAPPTAKPTGRDVVPPTDLELMMLADGELDPARQAEVEAFLAADEDGATRGKLAGLRAVGAIVAATGGWPEREGVDVTAEVMRRIESGGRDATDRPADRATLGGAARSRRSGSVSPAAPANDNSRLIYGLALAAAAAAAGVFVWGRGADPDDGMVARSAGPDVAASVGASSSPLAAAPPREPATPPEASAAAEAGSEARYGVEVASVDFGQRSGAIYYVPAGGDAPSAAAVTTVVWLTDE